MEVVIVLGGPNTKEDIKALLEHRYGKVYEDFRFVGVDGGALRLLDQHLPMEVAIGDFDSVTKEQRDLIHEAAGTIVQQALLSSSLLKKTILTLRQLYYG